MSTAETVFRVSPGYRAVNFSGGFTLLELVISSALGLVVIMAVITLFGITALFTYPFLAHWLFAGNVEQIDLFLGTAIHDASQVAGAGLMYQLYFDAPQALEVAATTKLVRNLFMGAVIPFMAVIYH